MGDSENPGSRTNLLRCFFGGALMGLANLVPGISGGTMLLAAGVYQAFIRAVAHATTLRFRRDDLILLAAVVGAALAAILLLAGPTRDAVLHYPMAMYSLFIGLTLGGVPLIWRLARPPSPALWCATGCAFALMVGMSLGQAGDGGSSSSITLLFLAGVAGASAMILPGISGGYLLLLLGQYVVILNAIDGLKTGLSSLGTTGFAGLWGPLEVIVPVGLGVVAGVVVVSNLLRFAMDRFRDATLGALLGLLIGAVAGLWPFQTMAPGATLDDPVFQRFAPSIGQALAAVALVALGFAVTVAISRLGGEMDSGDTADT